MQKEKLGTIIQINLLIISAHIIDEKKQAAIFLTVIGSETYNLLKKLTCTGQTGWEKHLACDAPFVAKMPFTRCFQR